MELRRHVYFYCKITVQVFVSAMLIVFIDPLVVCFYSYSNYCLASREFYGLFSAKIGMSAPTVTKVQSCIKSGWPATYWSLSGTFLYPKCSIQKVR